MKLYERLPSAAYNSSHNVIEVPITEDDECSEHAGEESGSRARRRGQRVDAEQKHRVSNLGDELQRRADERVLYSSVSDAAALTAATAATSEANSELLRRF
jgi:hypothetical protein